MAKSKSKKRIFRDEMKEFLNDISHNLTRKQYRYNIERFCDYAYNLGIRSKSECTVDFIKLYCEYLKPNYTASTIHTMLAPVCRCLNVKMNEINNKPLRHTSENVRGRSFNNIKSRSDNDENDPRWNKLLIIANSCGLRRNELKNLKIKSFIPEGFIDDFDYLCVVGKGGKKTYQRLLYRNEEEQDMVREWFNPLAHDMNDFVFQGNEFQGNSLNLHRTRSDVAKRAYRFYVDQMNFDHSYRDQLINECKRQWDLLNHRADGTPRNFPTNRYTGYYYLRGKNRDFALKNKLPISYDKLAVLACSLFHLAHNRLDTTVCNYLLAI